MFESAPSDLPKTRVFTVIFRVHPAYIPRCWGRWIAAARRSERASSFRKGSFQTTELFFDALWPRIDANNAGVRRVECIDDWRNWVGRTERRVDQVRAAPVAALAATLDLSAPEPLPGTDLPPLWHWLYFTPRVFTCDIDSHGAAPDQLVPSRSLAHRTCAGGRVWFHHPLRIDDEITRVSRIVEASQARITVRHEITNALGLAITEEEEIVCGDAAAAPAPVTATGSTQAYSRTVRPTPLLLFRYSALTFNAHRVHYDRAYAIETGGFPGLIVHAPLIALLLVNHLRQQEPAAVRSFAFTNVRPVFDTAPLTLYSRTEYVGRAGRRAAMWARDSDGTVAMHAHAELIDEPDAQTT